jgi:hypothetical protein
MNCALGVDFESKNGLFSSQFSTIGDTQQTIPKFKASNLNEVSTVGFMNQNTVPISVNSGKQVKYLDTFQD